jgi:CheY-like chemotaxis protein
MSSDGLRSEAFLTHSGVAQFPPTCMIVEDQTLIGLSLEAYLEDTGFGACPMFPSSAEALAWLATNTPTVAIIDFTLREGPCTKLVRILRKRDIPFVIYSGHKRSVHRKTFRMSLGSASPVIGRSSGRLSPVLPQFFLRGARRSQLEGARSRFRGVDPYALQ